MTVVGCVCVWVCKWVFESVCRCVRCYMGLYDVVYKVGLVYGSDGRRVGMECGA